MKKKFIFNVGYSLIASLFFVACTSTKTIVNKRIQPFQIDSNFNNAHYGICVYEPATNLFLVKHESNKYFVPASNIKIVTCYTAMKILGDSLIGAEYYETDSSIHLLGVGDPTLLMTDDFKNQPIVNWLKNQPKKIYLHKKGFEAEGLGYGWSWDDYEATYMAERSFMPMYGNVVTFYDSNGIKSNPPLFQKLITSTFDVSDGSKGFNVSRKLARNEFAITPSKNNKPKDLTFSTLQNNGNESLDLACNLLSDALQKQVFRGGNFDSKLGTKIYSQPTDSMLKIMMHRSDNFFAEQSLLMASYKKLGLLNEEKLIETLLKNELKDLPQKPQWVDGSGLSRYNLFSPEDFVFILNKMKNEFGWERVKGILATGNDGTLKGLYKNYVNNIYAKTGTLSNHVALSGFITTKSGKELLFSVLVNHHNTSAANIRRTIEKFISNIIEEN